MYEQNHKLNYGISSLLCFEIEVMIIKLVTHTHTHIYIYIYIQIHTLYSVLFNFCVVG